jgi:hypothetical protein
MLYSNACILATSLFQKTNEYIEGLLEAQQLSKPRSTHDIPLSVWSLLDLEHNSVRDVIQRLRPIYGGHLHHLFFTPVRNRRKKVSAAWPIVSSKLRSSRLLFPEHLLYGLEVYQDLSFLYYCRSRLHSSIWPAQSDLMDRFAFVVCMTHLALRVSDSFGAFMADCAIKSYTGSSCDSIKETQRIKSWTKENT